MHVHIFHNMKINKIISLLRIKSQIMIASRLVSRGVSHYSYSSIFQSYLSNIAIKQKEMSTEKSLRVHHI